MFARINIVIGHLALKHTQSDRKPECSISGKKTISKLHTPYRYRDKANSRNASYYIIVAERG